MRKIDYFGDVDEALQEEEYQRELLREKQEYERLQRKREREYLRNKEHEYLRRDNERGYLHRNKGYHYNDANTGWIRRRDNEHFRGFRFSHKDNPSYHNRTFHRRGSRLIRPEFFNRRQYSGRTFKHNDNGKVAIYIIAFILIAIMFRWLLNHNVGLTAVGAFCLIIVVVGQFTSKK